MYICKKCLINAIGTSDNEIIKFYWSHVLCNKTCSKCNKICDVDFISENELEYIKNDKDKRVISNKESRRNRD